MEFAFRPFLLDPKGDASVCSEGVAWSYVLCRAVTTTTGKAQGMSVLAQADFLYSMLSTFVCITMPRWCLEHKQNVVGNGVPGVLQHARNCCVAVARQDVYKASCCLCLSKQQMFEQ